LSRSNLATDGFADLGVAAYPILFVIRNLAQYLLARRRIVAGEEEGEEVEPALGLGHRT
jgi:hypothetical protein